MMLPSSFDIYEEVTSYFTKYILKNETNLYNKCYVEL